MSLQGASILAGVVEGGEWALIVVCATKKYKETKIKYITVDSIYSEVVFISPAE